jgi:molybdopterin molybdotransferase
MPDTTVADARTLLRSWCVATAVEEVPTPAALHRTLARRVRAESDVRPEPTAAMDGIAVRAADTPGTVTVTGEVRAGASGAGAAALAPGAAVWISTGAVLPPGADAVVRRERFADDGGAVDWSLAVPAVEPDTDVRPSARSSPTREPGSVRRTSGCSRPSASRTSPCTSGHGWPC